MSGAAEYMNECDRRAEEGTVLANDGSSAHILTERLMSVAVLAH
jgi:hypothetical protein